jgi:hypothetical protein
MKIYLKECSPDIIIIPKKIELYNTTLKKFFTIMGVNEYVNCNFCVMPVELTINE